jgi:hypothetical protein
MSWSPNDLVSDADLQAYERTILNQFGQDEWQAKRQKALEDWLFPLLASSGLNPYRLRTRFQPQAVFGYTSSVYTDLTTLAQSTTADTINLATTLAASSDALVIGAPWQFRGVSIRMLDSVSSAASNLTVEIWRDQWKTSVSEHVTDGTVGTIGKPFSKGGAITWTVPEDWVVRPVNSSAALYYARLRLSAAPTGATIGQISVIRRSHLCAAATLRTLACIFYEAPISQEGPWKDKAEWYEREAQHAWERVQPLIGGEFDTDPVDDVIDADEATQTTDQASGGGWTLERC